KALDDKLRYPLMIISKDEHLTHSVPRELVYFPVVVDGDTGMDDSTGVSASLDGEISSGERKSWESNSDNTGGITVGEAIRACSGGIATTQKGRQGGDVVFLVTKGGGRCTCKQLGDIRVMSWRC
nr:hypothetical protein [Tanacetum cinerariifolium]GEY77954.1 hypothetical protein [Tanacetum cinerariifolium]